MKTMKGQNVARALHERLTEKGLRRVITKTVVINRRDFDELSPDELAKLITIEPLKISRGYGSKKISRGDTRKISLGDARKSAKKSHRHQNYWIRIKKELRTLICTNDRKNATLRRQFTKGKSQTTFVTIICGGIAEHIGGSPAVIMPLIALALMSFLELGINAYCAGR